MSEINKAGRTDPVVAAEGAIKLIECLVEGWGYEITGIEVRCFVAT